MDKVQYRLWIAVPFIGNWHNVQRIIGTKWITDTDINIRLLTDVNNESHIKADTIKQFQHRAEIRSLTGLHAKIYVIDDKVLLTSANLTGTAFSKRYEFGILINFKGDIEKVFNSWWDIASIVDSKWIPKKRESLTKIEKDESDTAGLQNLWALPEYPFNIKKFKKYTEYVKSYNHFKEIYLKNVRRLWDNVPIYHEIDSFFNYLYHEHSMTPSKKYQKTKYRVLSDRQRIVELIKYHAQFLKWLKTNKWESDSIRLKRIESVQELLSPKSIDKISHSNIEVIISNIHSMNSLPFNRVVFLKENNNPLSSIIKSWKFLLHRNDLPIEIRMEKCNDELLRFGKSAIQELLSCYYPEKYPVINSNSNCGMKFFGYDIVV